MGVVEKPWGGFKGNHSQVSEPLDHKVLREARERTTPFEKMYEIFMKLNKKEYDDIPTNPRRRRGDLASNVSQESRSNKYTRAAARLLPQRAASARQGQDEIVKIRRSHSSPNGKECWDVKDGSQVHNGYYHPGSHCHHGRCVGHCCHCQVPCGGACGGTQCSGDCKWTCCGRTGRKSSWPGCTRAGSDETCKDGEQAFRAQPASTSSGHSADTSVCVQGKQEKRGRFSSLFFGASRQKKSAAALLMELAHVRKQNCEDQAYSKSQSTTTSKKASRSTEYSPSEASTATPTTGSCVQSTPPASEHMTIEDVEETFGDLDDGNKKLARDFGKIKKECHEHYLDDVDQNMSSYWISMSESNDLAPTVALLTHMATTLVQLQETEDGTTLVQHQETEDGASKHVVGSIMTKNLRTSIELHVSKYHEPFQ